MRCIHVTKDNIIFFITTQMAGGIGVSGSNVKTMNTVYIKNSTKSLQCFHGL